MDRRTIITGIKIAPAGAALLLTTSLLLAACGGGGGGSSTPSSPVYIPTIAPTVAPTVTPTITPSPGATPTLNPQSFTCPTTSAVQSVARSTQTVRRSPHGRHIANTTPQYTQLAVSYDHATATSNARQIAARETALGATLVSSFNFAATNTTMHVVSVATTSVAKTEASLRMQAGVTAVGITGQRRFHSTTAAHWTNDPYFTGRAPNFDVLPYAESATVPGQWDMHAIGLEHAYGYADAGTTYTSNPNALGSSSVKIAIIDTGVDITHPELTSKVPYAKCFVSSQSGATQTTGTYVTDEDGHGTDVSGIAAAASNNALGFTGAGGNAVIYAYRVFPTPDASCAGDSGDDSCSSSTTDIVSAIDDAIAQHVNVISMSLGGGTCTNGVDDDKGEGAAVASAIAAGIIVVAAAGNDNPSTAGVDAPGCDTGVIAVGATSLDDGTSTGSTGEYTTTKVTTATATAPVEYVANYSQFGTTNTYQSTASWGIVAPGGDPSNSELATNATPDDLHWIENIWTSTPFGGATGSFAGNCQPDFNAATGTGDCRTLIAGTSMSTPHVAGAAALILSVNPSYQSAAAMRQLLCSTADDLGDTHQGCGRLNLYRAMAVAMNDSVKP